MSTAYAVIMAGGSGTRFWPASRERRPKQLLPLGTDGNESLIAATVRRIEGRIGHDRVYIATGERIVSGIADALPGIARAQLLAEPVPRNTAACIGWATATIARRDPEALVAVLPSDHVIADEPGFLACIDRAFATAESDRIVTIGIVPTRPETGYGYIEVGDELAPGVRCAERFVEKPERDVAERYVAGGRHLWNAGMFFFRARVMLDAIRKLLPDLANGLDRLDAAARRGGEATELRNVFPALPSISIDHGVMERAAGLAVVPGDFGWSDLGSWQTAWELAAHDENGNALPSGAVAVDAKNNLVRDLSGRPPRIVALVGVSDLVVVETDDALLVIPRDRAQDVRAVVDALRARGDGHAL